MRWMALLAAIVILYCAPRTSFLIDKDDTNQALAWQHFVSENLRHGTLPLWDPYTQGGRSYIGEMQTALFYPLKLPMYFLPPTVGAQRAFFVIAHILAGWFMFLLARELGIEPIGSLIAGACFSLGGFMGGPVMWDWPHLIDAGVWLPLVLLFIARREPIYAGVALAMPVLAGGLHIAIMDVLVVIAVCVAMRAWKTLAITGAVSFGASAIQLLPSIEYSQGVERYINDALYLPATQKIPYDQILYNYPPRAALAFFWGRAPIGLAEFSPYFGLLPLGLAIYGALRYRRYALAAGATLAFLYALGSSFPLHRILYETIPYLWLAKEPGRFIYLTHFSLALLAGYGARRLRPSYAAAMLIVMLVDWSYFARHEGKDYLQEMTSAAGVAQFLKAQPGTFRVNVAGLAEPNIGDFYGIATTSGLGSTRSLDFKNVWTLPNAADLLNVRYFVGRTATVPANVKPAYRDAEWTAILNTDPFSHAWIEGGSATVTNFATNHLTVEVHATKPGQLVLSENYSPGWHAKVNGIDTPIQKVYVTLKGIDVPAGDSRVELNYLPRSFVAGAILTLLTFMLAAGRRIQASNAYKNSDS